MTLHYAVTEGSMERILEALSVYSAKPVIFSALDVAMLDYGVPTAIRCDVTLVARDGSLRSVESDDSNFLEYETLHTRGGYDVVRFYDRAGSLVAVIADGLDPDIVREEGGQ